ncbi:mitotic fidelity of chromosome transmission- protein [Malassezia caprae]|uniref:CENP-C homolog n=1 Tax=Malassezia caprae TaxID=1381934 RepID=A0AAF0EAR7_9BASI|nr:mitotic fidelity of chromosome transmission- protein [Malassezia caprae]
MSAGPAARRFHEAGLGSRTGLRIGAVQQDAYGHDDLDAFFAESKRVLEWMAHSDDEASDSSTSHTEAERSAPAAVEPEASWSKSAPRASEWAARTAVPRSTDAKALLDEARARHSLLPRAGADESLWESTVDLSREERTFHLSALAGDVSAAAPSEPVVRAVERTPSSTLSLEHTQPTPAPPSMPGESTPMPVLPRHERPRPSHVPDTDLPSFLRPDASVLASAPAWSRGTTPASASEASEYDAMPELDMAMPDDESVPDDEPVPEEPVVPKKRGRGRPRKDASMPPPRGRPGRPPGRQMPPQKIVERIHDPPTWQLDNPQGLRRGKRHRIAPLDWWRGERALYGRPEEPSEAGAPAGLVAPVLKEVIRVPRAPGEGTFSGMRRFRIKPPVYVPSDRPPTYAESVDESDDETADASRIGMALRPPEEGWDEDTDPYGRVVDADQGTEVTMRIACTAKGIRPRPAFNQKFSYEKIFGVGDFMAAGVLVIPQGGEKPTKPSKDNNYTFVVLEGAVQVMVHRTRFVIAPGGMFLVPKGNTYNIRNVSQREARIFFAQARHLATPLTDVVHDGRTAFAHGTEHVQVEPAPEADASSVTSTDSDDVDASSDYDDTRHS